MNPDRSSETNIANDVVVGGDTVTTKMSVMAGARTDKDGYRKLGRKAFMFLVLERSTFSLMLIILECMLIAARIGETPSFIANASQNIGLNTFMMINGFISGALLVVPIILALAIILCMFTAYTTYSSLRYKIDENGFALERGLMSRDRVSLPFRQIQNVDIEQSFIYRIFGMCNLIILTAGHEDKSDASRDDQSEIILPAISFSDAQSLQVYLLGRANIDEVEPEHI